MATKGKVKDLIKILKAAGFVEVPCNVGSHRKFKHVENRRTVQVSGKDNASMPERLWNKILRQAGLK